MNITRSILFLCLFSVTHVYASNCVILLHGLARTNASMSKMETALEEAGFKTVNHDYPSTEHGIAKLSKDEISAAIHQCSLDDTIHFVTHSLGGILVRYYVQNQGLEQLGRVVMLGPPNEGSHVVDLLRNSPGFELINGPAGQQLGTEETSIPNQLGPANFDVGIIAGSSSINLILSTMLENPDDGKVSVDSTKLEGMSDHIVLPVTHPLMMKNDEVIFQTVHFLKSGKFKHATVPDQNTENRNYKVGNLEWFNFTVSALPTV